MKIRFSLFVILASNFFLISCSETARTTYVPVPGYPRPRAIKLVEAEESWKQRADRMMLARFTPEITKKVTIVAKIHPKKTTRKISSSRKLKVNLLAVNSRVKAYKKTLPVW